MSVRKLAATLLALFALVGAEYANAQERFPNAPPADPFAFDPDFNWFEPVTNLDLLDLKPLKRATTGWYATYDRLVLYGSRPETDDTQASETQLDRGFGQRYQLGYRLDNGQGWQFTWHETSVHEGFFVRREASNRNNGVDQAAGGAGGTADIDPFFGFVTPPGAENNLGSDFRFFDIGNTENSVDYDSYELVKTWRLEPYHYGGILEPLVGIRWQRVRDTNRRTVLNQVGSLTNTGTSFLNTFLTGDQVFTDQAITDNELLGAQFGFKYTKYRGRFTYSGDFRVFFGENFQNSVATQEELIFDFGADPAPGDVPNAIQRASTEPINTENEEFFIGFDIKAQLAYQLTKQITIRTGVQVIDIATGVWRGGAGTVPLPVGDQDQDLVLAGATFGLTLNL